ncbi:hypothetical protein TrLO_g12914 [Triparma laevis f. longispina]|uniref:Uncharacterized protein n=1 Tax=Triparma laevis f. longispina TaxID=1714387 RepID=A0A9W7KYS9_9STRA|nr:hypothetical protein TrLO_g12914 [Triparma laevis f. longispina]
MGLGLYRIDAVDRQINSGISTTLLIPFPLKYDEQPELQADRSKMKADMRKLADYYGKIGFADVGWPDSQRGMNFVAKWNGWCAPEDRKIVSEFVLVNKKKIKRRTKTIFDT